MIENFTFVRGNLATILFWKGLTDWLRDVRLRIA